MKRLYVYLVIPVVVLLASLQDVYAQSSTTYPYSGSIVTWTVPAGVTSIGIQAKGGQGGNISQYSAPGGQGAVIYGEFTVIPGHTLSILVGGQGGNGTYTGGGGGG